MQLDYKKIGECKFILEMQSIYKFHTFNFSTRLMKKSTQISQL